MRRDDLIPAVTLLDAVILVFGASYNYGFMCWDDGINITENPYINPPSLRNLPVFWDKPYKHLYIPVTYTVWLSLSFIGRFLYAVEPGSAGPAAHPFHAANLILHALNSVLAYLIVLRLLQAQGGERRSRPLHWAALGGALVFALHPLQTEPVCWVTGMKDLLFGFFSLVAIWQYVNYREQRVQSDAARGRRAPRQYRRYGCATAAFLLAILSKPTGIVVPIIALIIDRLVYERPLRKSILPLGAWGVAALPILLYTKHLQPERLMGFVPPLWARPFIAADAIAFYLFKLFVPFRLGPDYGRSPDLVMRHFWIYVAWVIPAALIAAAWRLRNRHRAPLTAVGIFIAALAPVLGLVPFGFQMHSTTADRFLYLPMLGAALAFAWFLSLRKGRAPAFACAAVVFLLGIRSALLAEQWRSSRSLCSLALRVNPESPSWRNNLGLLLFEGGQIDEALAHYAIALRFRPDDVEAHNNMGNALAAKGDLAAAIEHYSRALELDPRHAAALNNKGVAYYKQGEVERAMECYGKAVRLDPGYAPAHNNLGLARMKLGALKDAVSDFNRAIALLPSNADFHLNIAKAYSLLGDIRNAGEHYRTALRVNPGCEEARRLLAKLPERGPRGALPARGVDPKNIYRALANSMESKGELEKAVAYYAKALEVEPESADLHNSIAILNAKMGHTETAVAHFGRSLELDPDNADTLNNLGNCYYLRGDTRQAAEYYARALRLAPDHREAKANLGRIDPSKK